MVTYRTYRGEDSTAVRGIFARGLRDLSAGYEAEMERYIQQSLADDLADVCRHYLDAPDNHFWVAEVDSAVKGMLGVQRRSDEEAELRRVSVAPDARRLGIGFGLLNTAEAFCRERGCQRMVLTTITLMGPAIAMYQKFGFRMVGQERYGAFTGEHYQKDL